VEVLEGGVFDEGVHAGGHPVLEHLHEGNALHHHPESEQRASAHEKCRERATGSEPLATQTVTASPACYPSLFCYYATRAAHSRRGAATLELGAVGMDALPPARQSTLSFAPAAGKSIFLVAQKQRSLIMMWCSILTAKLVSEKLSLVLF